MKSSRLSIVRCFLQFLVADCITVQQSKALLSKLSKQQARALTEIFHNLLRGTLKINPDLKKTVKRHGRVLKKLSSERLSIDKRKKLLKRYSVLILYVLKNIKSLLKRVW